jgi:hypothetical protein
MMAAGFFKASLRPFTKSLGIQGEASLRISVPESDIASYRLLIQRIIDHLGECGKTVRFMNCPRLNELPGGMKRLGVFEKSLQ